MRSDLKALLVGLSALAFALCGSAHALPMTVDADAFPIGTTLDSAFPGVSLSVTGLASGTVIGMDGFSSFNGRNIATTGSLVFGVSPVHPTVPQGWETFFRIFRADFANPTDHVSIDFIADDDDTGELRAFDAAGQLLATVSTGLIRDAVFTATIIRASADIAYVTAAGITGESMFLDNLRFDASAVPEPATFALLAIGLVGLRSSRRKTST